MKRLITLSLALSMLLAALHAHASPATSTDGTLVHWHRSVDRALAVARAENKPVLLLQMFGRLDEELC